MTTGTHSSPTTRRGRHLGRLLVAGPLLWVGRGLRVLLVLTLGLLLGLVCFVLSPPGDVLRRAGLVIGRQVLHHENLELAALELSPLHGLELRGLWLGPPAGYRWPLFTLRRLAVRWELGGLLARREVRLGVEIERPLLRVEARQGKLGWLAFLEGLPPSPPKPEEPKGEPPDLRVVVDRVSVTGVGALVDDGKQRLLLDGLGLEVSGLYSKARTHLDLALRLAEPRPGQPNLALLLPAQPGQPRLGGRFRLHLGLDASLEGLEKPQARLRLRSSLATVEIRAPWKLEPLSVELGLAAGVDLAKQRAALEELRVRFNGSELLDLRAAVKGLEPPRELSLQLKNLHLPLDALAPYVRAVVPGLEVGGELLVRDLAPSVDLQSVQSLLGSLKPGASPAALLEALSRQVPPRVTGLVEARGLRARLRGRGQPVEARGIDLRLAFASSGAAPAKELRPEAVAAALPALGAAPAPDPAGKLPLLVQSRLNVGRLVAAGAEVRDLELRLAAGADLEGARPRSLATRLSLEVPTVRYRDPKLGAIELGLHTRLRANGDLKRSRVTLEELELGVSDWLRVRVSGTLRDFQRKLIEARIVVEPLQLERAVAALPAPLRASLGRLDLGGRLGLQAQLHGRVPGPRTPPLELPVELDARLALSDVRVHDPARQVFLEKLGGELRTVGKPSDLRVSDDLSVGSLRVPAQRLSVKGARLPLELHLSPAGVEARLGVELERASQGAALGAERPKFSLELRAALPLARAIAGRPFAPTSATVRLGLGAPSLTLRQPGSSLAVRDLRVDTSLGYEPQRAEPLSLAVDVGAGSVRHAEQGASLEGLALKLRTGLGGPRLQAPLPFDPGGLTPRSILALLQRVRTELELRVGRVGLPGLPGQPLRDNRLELAVAVGADQTVELGKLRLSVPGRGLELALSGRVEQVLSVGLGPLPPFDLRLRAGLDNPVTHESRRALVVAPDLKVAGKVGLEARLRRLGPDRVKLDGSLLARRFNLWMRSVAVEDQGANQLRRTRTLHVKDLDAEVPIAQELVVKLPSVSLPPPRRSVLEGGEAASALYSALQPYGGSRSRLRIDGISLDEQNTATTREGYFISTVPRHYQVDRVALDLGLADSTLELSRLYVKVFGGDITGEVQGQLVSLAPLDVRLRLRTQVTGVNLAYLDPAAKERTKRTEVSALVDVKYWLSRQLVEGRIDITRLSLDMLDSLLAYLNPNKTNQSVQNNRKLINAWYVKKMNPRVKLVSIWVAHANLNMDIDMGAWFLAGTYLESQLKANRIRRLSILPFLPKGAASGAED